MTDQDTTQVMPPADPPPEPQPEGTKRLLRSRSDRMLGGVAGGLADYFRVDPVIFRIGFGVTLFFGGLGALVYLAMMIFVPSEQSDGTEPSSAPRTFGRVAAPDRRRDRRPDRALRSWASERRGRQRLDTEFSSRSS